MNTITATQQTRRAELRARYEAHESACDSISPRKRNGWRVMTAEESARVATLAPMTNENRAELETLDFLADKPDRVFVYPENATPIRKLTGWTGNPLLTVLSLGAPFRANFGDTRQSVQAMGINGVRYVGTIYGTFARLRKAKGQ